MTISKQKNKVKGTVQFRISKKKEVEEILWIYSNLSFLRKHSSRLLIPQFSKQLTKKVKTLGGKKRTLDKSTHALLIKEFSSLYSPERYRAILAEVKKRWHKIEKKFFKEVSTLPKLRFKNTYICYITFYGGGGSFGRNNQIYVRVNPHVPSDIRLANYTIIHELVHLMFEPYAQTHDFSHSAKERFVESVIQKSTIKKLLGI